MTETTVDPDSGGTDENRDTAPCSEQHPDRFGRLVAVGIGPGRPDGMTIRAREALESAEHIVGYETYIDLLPADILDDTTEVFATGMGSEVSRTEVAVDRAMDGAAVALVGSGDPNVYALGGLVLEVLESRDVKPDAVDFEAVPGVPAAQSSAARLGAPLVNDAVTISLSDHLTTIEEIESRLRAVAPENFAIAIYNPWSPNRAENFQLACEILLEHRTEETPVGIVHGAGRADEATHITDLGELPKLGGSDILDMTATIIVGTEETRVWGDRLITPRGYERKYDY
ncbi:precorrin-3B C(17)-methyltransferase [Halodesulfurarchaeum sp.]|uniref:precorrin-3B C(17)-methyltransferase n=1 Tax=Halodesulfurarchaeum sp. TaxID=1980530 RepID=UPI001BBFC38C|nr:precorrin-3B C(17)-methyltransferase [Halodesulfurarchaeum sp.]